MLFHDTVSPLVHARAVRPKRHGCLATVLVLAAFVPQPALASCGAAFCMVNTNWNMQGFAPEPGLRMDLRFEYIDQDKPRTANRDIPFGQIRRHHDELRTINRNYITTFDYTFNKDWGAAVTLPIVDRSHGHIHNHRGAQLFEPWQFTNMGDVSVVVRRQWMSENQAAARLAFYGVNFGIKLPTGETTVANDFRARAERSLQPGTGSTDLLLGAYYSQVLPAAASSWFTQALWQTPVDIHGSYRPGRRVSFDVGYRYELNDRVGLMLQVNSLYRGRDSGIDAEPDDSGGRFVFVSPGASYALTKTAQIYTFLHKPVYQHVSGVQIVADWSVVAGLNFRF